MDIFFVVLWILLGILLIFGVIPCFILSYIIFATLLVRRKPEKWGHTCSQPDDPQIVAIFGEGTAWRDAHADRRSSVYIKNDGLSLYGEYFDFGHDRTVIILPGRMECCIYACFFAEPYRMAGYNILVVDGRAHGLSEGRYNYVGFKECEDILAWGRYLHDQKGNRSVILHGICIGASTSLLAMTSDRCPDYFDGIVVEGMFKSFYESTKNHMKHNHRPLFPFLYLVMFYMRVILGTNPVTDGPYKRIGKLRKPILFLHGRRDVYSLPAQAEALYAACNAPKRLVWMEEGAHSRLRIVNTEAYDAAVRAFLAEHSLCESAAEVTPRR